MTDLTTQPTPAQPPTRGILRRCLSALSGALALLAWLVLALWLFGIVATDRTLLSQYLFWFAPAVLAASIALATASRLLRTLGRSPKKTGVHWWRWAALAAVAWTFATMFNLHAPLRRWWSPTITPSASIRITHWNRSVFECRDLKAAAAALNEAGTPDVLCISMLNKPDEWAALTASMGTTHLVNLGIDKVFSKYPVTFARMYAIPMQPERDGTTSAGEAPPVPVVPPAARNLLVRCFRMVGLRFRPPEELDDATAVVVTIDTTASIGRPMTIYFVDMPSNPLAWRPAIARRVAAHLRALRDHTDPNERIPSPDVVVGDFNIPIGSWSLDLFEPGFAPASDSAGIGRLASWPRPWCVFQLDHMLVAPGWGTDGYRLSDPGCAEHMVESAAVWPLPTRAK